MALFWLSDEVDVTGGRVVKGVNFVALRDAGDPVEIAARYNEQGADELTFLDITAIYSVYITKIKAGFSQKANGLIASQIKLNQFCCQQYQ